MEWLAAHPEIVLGAATGYPPMVIKRADGTYVGVLVDLFEQISRDQAADLLKQFRDFVVSCHNKRFQIDVQALQALLHDCLGEETAALESLTHALQLAEPGGFIRPFVDLGPPMADLLKRLHRKKMAGRLHLPASLGTHPPFPRLWSSP